MQPLGTAPFFHFSEQTVVSIINGFARHPVAFSNKTMSELNDT